MITILNISYSHPAKVVIVYVLSLVLVVGMAMRFLYKYMIKFQEFEKIDKNWQKTLSQNKEKIEAEKE
jgi:hypothetical protein